MATRLPTNQPRCQGEMAVPSTRKRAPTALPFKHRIPEPVFDARQTGECCFDQKAAETAFGRKGQKDSLVNRSVCFLMCICVRVFASEGFHLGCKGGQKGEPTFGPQSISVLSHTVRTHTHIHNHWCVPSKSLTLLENEQVCSQQWLGLKLATRH